MSILEVPLDFADPNDLERDFLGSIHSKTPERIKHCLLTGFCYLQLELPRFHGQENGESRVPQGIFDEVDQRLSKLYDYRVREVQAMSQRDVDMTRREVEVARRDVEMARRDAEMAQRELLKSKEESQRELLKLDKIHEDIIQSIETQYEALVEKARLETRLEMTRSLSDKDKEYERSQGELSSLRARFQEIEVYKREMESLRQEIAILKKTASGRGNIGEWSLREMLREMFPSYDVRDMSKVSSSCDIHVYIDPSRFFAVESKHKQQVTGGDVEKFERDCQHLSATTSFLGAIFVSLSSENIPNKGPFSFEVVSGNPIVYIGLSSLEGESRILKDSVKLIEKSSAILRSLDKNDEECALRVMRDKLKPLVGRMGRLRSLAISMRNHAREILKGLDSSETDVSLMIGEMTRIVESRDFDETQRDFDETQREVKEKETCPACQGRFANLKRHKCRIDI